MDYEVIHIREDERPLLADFLYEAIYVPEGFDALPDNRTFVVSADGEVVKTCWVRTTDEDGHIDNATPSFSISPCKPYRGNGIGPAIMRAMLADLRDAGHARALLSVQKENPRRSWRHRHIICLSLWQTAQGGLRPICTSTRLSARHKLAAPPLSCRRANASAQYRDAAIK